MYHLQTESFNCPCKVSSTPFSYFGDWGGKGQHGSLDHPGFWVLTVSRTSHQLTLYMWQEQGINLCCISAMTRRLFVTAYQPSPSCCHLLFWLLQRPFSVIQTNALPFSPRQTTSIPSTAQLIWLKLPCPPAPAMGKWEAPGTYIILSNSEMFMIQISKRASSPGLFLQSFVKGGHGSTRVFRLLGHSLMKLVALLPPTCTKRLTHTKANTEESRAKRRREMHSWEHVWTPGSSYGWKTTFYTVIVRQVNSLAFAHTSVWVGFLRLETETILTNTLRKHMNDGRSDTLPHPLGSS